MDLVEFLTARYDEEQRLAGAASEPGMGANWHTAGMGADGRFVAEATEGAGSWGIARFTFAGHGTHAAYWDPARVLADIAAKRGLLAFAAEYASEQEDHYGTGDAPALPPAENPVLRLLAAPYAGHPDYNPAWRIDG